jgi:hypothetical protein
MGVGNRGVVQSWKGFIASDPPSQKGMGEDVGVGICGSFGTPSQKGMGDDVGDGMGIGVHNGVGIGVGDGMGVGIDISLQTQGARGLLQDPVAAVNK